MFKRYSEPRLATFLDEANQYGPDGWIKVEKRVLVIGETDDMYVTRLHTSCIPYWDEYGRYEAHSTTTMGFHRSRFVRFEQTQLQIFATVGNGQ